MFALLFNTLPYNTEDARLNEHLILEVILKEEVKLPEVRPIVSAEDYEKLGAKTDSQISEEVIELMISSTCFQKTTDFR